MQGNRSEIVPVGRAGEFALLTDLVGGPTGNAVVITGEPGIGKTTIALSIAAWAEAQSITVGWGVAGEWEGASPLWPWFEALSAIDPDQDVLSTGASDELEPADRARLFQRVARWLAQRSADQPVLVVIEDLHAARQTAAELFAYLSRRPLPRGLTVLATARPTPDHIRDLTCPRIALDGLGPAEVALVAQGMGRTVDERAAAALARRTGGNPLFVVRLLEAGFTGSEHDAGLPTDISALIMAQVQEAAAEARPLLDALAVSGAASADVLVRMIGSTDLAAPARHLPSSLVQLDGDQVTFRHSLVRETIYDMLSTEQRFALHARAAEVLEPHAGAITVAHHLARAASADRGPGAAAAARRAATIARSIGALTEAADHQNLAVTILRDQGPSVALAEATVELMTLLGELGRVGEAEALVEAVVEIDVELPPGLRRDLVRGYGRLRWREEPDPSVLHPDALERLARRWLGDSVDASDVVVFHTAMLHAAEIRGFVEDDLAHADAAVAAADDAGDPVLAAEAYVARRRALMVFPELVDERRAASEAGLELALASRDGELTSRARRLALCDAMTAGDRERALMLVPTDEVTVAARQHQALTFASIAALEGRYDDADRVLDEATKELQYLGLDAPTLDFVRIVHSWDLGRLEAALAEFEPLLPVVADPALRSAVALAKAMEGKDAVAATLVEETFLQLSTGTPSLLWSVAMTLIGEAAAAVDHELVPDIHDRLAPFAGLCVVPPMAPVPWVGSVDRVLGLLCLRMGRVDDAVRHLEISLVAHQRMRAEPWAARSHGALAIALAAAGDDAAAATHADAAQQIVAKLGMAPDVVVIGDLGPRVPAPPPSPAATATDDRRLGTFVREGSVWRVAIGEHEALVSHAQGMVYLERLLSTPGADWHVLDLYTVPGEAPREGSAGAVIDSAARRNYQERHRELVQELERATTNADLGAVERWQRELDALEHELLSAFGIGGRARTMADPTERARVNVRRAITRAFDRIGTHVPSVADHLRRSVETGRFCRYTPDQGAPVTWR